MNGIKSGLEISIGFSISSSHSITKSGWEKKTLKTFEISKDNVGEQTTEIINKIDALSKEFKKIYVSAVTNKYSKITMTLSEMKRV